MKDADHAYLAESFADLINYDDDDPTAPIDPFFYRTPEGDSCLHIAAFRGDLRAVGILLDAGMDANLRGDLANTPLHYALMRGNHEIAALLVQRGASPDLLNDFGDAPGSQG